MESLLQGNQADSSGGGLDVHLTSGGQTQMSVGASTLSSNTASTFDGGGMHVSAEGHSQATIDMERVTLDRNGAGWNGGALYIWASASSTATLTLTNATLSGNRSNTDGGGIHSLGSTLRIIHGTITGNRADDDGNDSGDGGGIRASGGSVGLTGTLVALNADGSGAAGIVDPDVSGAVDGDAHNLIGDLAGAEGTVGTGTDVVTSSPGLTPLAKRGGEMASHGLMPGSPAVDAIPSAACAVGADQRGKIRPWDGDRDGDARCDIGAFELYPWWVFVPVVGVHPSP
jgi:hypothetical protein